MSPYV